MKERDKARAWCRAMGYKDPSKMFNANKHGAKQRGIKWSLTFEEWWGLWKDHYGERGRKPMDKCLCRNMDAGGYELGNIRIDYVKSNSQERSLVHKSTKPRWMKTQYHVPDVMDRPNLKEYVEDEPEEMGKSA